MGSYTGGEGTFPDDPMKFVGGDSVNCGNGNQRSCDAYWYCWRFYEDTYPPLYTVELFWVEAPECHYSVYMYTPLACS